MEVLFDWVIQIHFHVSWFWIVNSHIFSNGIKIRFTISFEEFTKLELVRDLIYIIVFIFEITLNFSSSLFLPFDKDSLILRVFRDNALLCICCKIYC